MATKQIAFKIDEDLHKKIKIRAINEEMDLKDWVREVLARAIKENGKK